MGRGRSWATHGPPPSPNRRTPSQLVCTTSPTSTIPSGWTSADAAARAEADRREPPSDPKAERPSVATIRPTHGATAGRARSASDRTMVGRRWTPHRRLCGRCRGGYGGGLAMMMCALACFLAIKGRYTFLRRIPYAFCYLAGSKKLTNRSSATEKWPRYVEHFDRLKLLADRQTPVSIES
jgi:hypothetical protein